MQWQSVLLTLDDGLRYNGEIVEPIFFFFQAEDGIRDVAVTGVQTCALPISHADDEHHRQQQREHERPPVAQELEIARVQHREEAAHHGRSSLPVSSRNRSSRLPGRIRRWPSGTRASSSVRSVASRSWVLISTRSLASMMLSGSSRAAGGNSWRGSSSSTSAKCSCSNRRGGPWAMM